MQMMNAQQRPARTVEEATSRPYKFWSTQPVPKMGEKSQLFCPSIYFCMSSLRVFIH